MGDGREREREGERERERERRRERGGKEEMEREKQKIIIIIIKIKNFVSCHQIVRFSPAFLLWGCENVFFDQICIQNEKIWLIYGHLKTKTIKK